MENEITYCAEQLKKQYGAKALEACRNIIKIKNIPLERKIQMLEVEKLLKER